MCVAIESVQPRLICFSAIRNKNKINKYYIDEHHALCNSDQERKRPQKIWKQTPSHSPEILYLNRNVRQKCISYSQFMIKQDLKQLVPAIRMQFCVPYNINRSDSSDSTASMTHHKYCKNKGSPETRARKRSACKTYTMKCFSLTSRAWPIFDGRTPINPIQRPCERSVMCAIKRLAKHKSILAN